MIIGTICFMVSMIGCGGDTLTAGSTETRVATVTRTASDQTSTAGDSVPVMPNVDESAVQVVTDSALAAYNRDWGDGSGVHVVWGPNIVSGWALIGVENNSGAAGKDVLLRQENGAWQVKDSGHGLSMKWEDQTPPGFWP